MSAANAKFVRTMQAAFDEWYAFMGFPERDRHKHRFSFFAGARAHAKGEAA